MYTRVDPEYLARLKKAGYHTPAVYAANIGHIGIHHYLRALGAQVSWSLDEVDATALVANIGAHDQAASGINYGVQVGQMVGGYAPCYSNVADTAGLRGSGTEFDTVVRAQAATYGFLLYPRAPRVGFGGTGFGYLWASANQANHYIQFNNSLNSITCLIDGATTDGRAVTTQGVVQYVWQWLIVRYATVAVGGTGIPEVLRYVPDTLVTLPLDGTETAVSGVVGLAGLTYNVFNRQLLDRGVDGAMRHHFGMSRYMTDAEVTKLGLMTPFARDGFEDIWGDIF